MNYVSFLFLIYVTAACLAYFLFPVVFRKFRSCQWMVLLAASWMFYLLCAGKYFFFLLVTSWTVYLGARLIQKQADLQHQALSGEKKSGREEKKAIRRAFTKRKHRILWAVLLLNFGILSFFKYVPDWIRAASDGEKQLSLLVPIGISFYTFQATGYLIDVCNGNVKAEKSFWKTALFVSFFPQIIQGRSASGILWQSSCLRSTVRNGQGSSMDWSSFCGGISARWFWRTAWSKTSIS